MEIVDPADRKSGTRGCGCQPNALNDLPCQLLQPELRDPSQGPLTRGTHPPRPALSLSPVGSMHRALPLRDRLHPVVNVRPSLLLRPGPCLFGGLGSSVPSHGCQNIPFLGLGEWPLSPWRSPPWTLAGQPDQAGVSSTWADSHTVPGDPHAHCPRVLSPGASSGFCEERPSSSPWSSACQAACQGRPARRAGPVTQTTKLGPSHPSRIHTEPWQMILSRFLSEPHDPCHPMRPILPRLRPICSFRDGAALPSLTQGSLRPLAPAPPDQKASSRRLSRHPKHLHGRSRLRFREKPERWRKRKACVCVRMRVHTHPHTHPPTHAHTRRVRGSRWSEPGETEGPGGLVAASSPWPQAEGKRAGEGGSHSPVHCRLTPTNSQSLLHPSP